MSPDDLAAVRLGTPNLEAEAIPLAAGALAAELVNGGLRAVRRHGVEVLRAVASVVRDHDWGTIAFSVRDLDVRDEAAGFSVVYRAWCRGAEGATLDLATRILERTDGTLDVSVEARPDRDVETNRCGFCVLHPVVGLAGRPVAVEHVDGAVPEAVWPELIEPWRPFKDIRATTRVVAPGLSATCRPDSVPGVAGERDGRTILWVANLTDALQTLAVPPGFRTVATLDETHRRTAASGDPPPASACAPRLRLQPYAVARLET